MKNLPLLFQIIESVGGELWLEEGKLKYRFPSNQLPSSFLQELKMLKGYILAYLEIERGLQEAGWLVGYRLEVYEYRLTKNHSVFLFNEDGKWLVWRATWQDGGEKPIKEKTRKQRADFNEAIEEAHKYISWYKTKVANENWDPPKIKKLSDTPPVQIAV